MRKTRRVRSQTKRSKPSKTPTTLHRAFMSVTQTWKNGQGQRNTVVIRNGQGLKRVERLGPRGNTVNAKTRKLTAPERKQILEGQFIPGLWKNCRLC